MPFSRLADEQLAPYRAVPYDTSVVVTRRSSRDCLVSYDGNLYSVPAAHAGQDLLLKATTTQLVVLTAQGCEVARHDVAPGHGQRIVVAAHYGGLPTKRPRLRAGQAQQREVPASDLAADAPQVEVRPLAVYDHLLVVPR